jgi:hypothetical protein
VRRPGSEKMRVWRGWMIPVLLAAVMAALLLAQRWEQAALTHRIEKTRDRLEALTRLNAENRALAKTALTPEALAHLRADRDALSRLRAEAETLRQAAYTRERSSHNKKPATSPSANATMRDAMMESAQWRNLGRSSAPDAIETALWAAAGGEVDLLQESLLLDDSARKKAQELFDGLMPELRARYVSPEKLVAFLTAKDVPLGAAQILKIADQKPEAMSPPALEHIVTVQLQAVRSAKRTLKITARETPEGWRLVVPESAVARYVEELKAR